MTRNVSGIKHRVPFKEKTPLFFMNFYFTRVSVHLLLLAAECNFSVYELIKWE